MQETKIHFLYRGMPVEVTFQQDWTVRVPKKFQWLSEWVSIGPLHVMFERQETFVSLTTPNGWVETSVRQSHKDFPSWRTGRFEALKKLLREYFRGGEFREFRVQAFYELSEMEELLA